MVAAAVIEVAALGSGSAGNAVLVRCGDTLLMVDAGFTLKEMRVRMAELGVSPDDLRGVLVTHEHGDHVRGIGPLSRKHGVPVWLTHGTWQRLRDQRFTDTHLFHAHEPFSIGDVHIDPFPTPHDAAESCQFVFSWRGLRFATVTDLGTCTPHVRGKLQDLNGVLVECNYDNHMLANGPYPPSLQARIRSDYGHLGNEQAGELLAELDHPGLHCMLLGHLSEKNNTGDVALGTVKRHVGGRHERLCVLEQHRCSRWFRIESDALEPAAGAAGVVAPQRVADPA